MWVKMGFMSTQTDLTTPSSSIYSDVPEGGHELIDELRHVATTLASETAQVIAEKRLELVSTGALTGSVVTKSSSVDPVTVVDKEAEAHIVKRLSQLRPGDGVLGEEGANEDSDTGVVWIVDPIDGTVNFLYGQPQYAVSVAAAYKGVVLAGAVINVVSRELFHAGKGFGASMEIPGLYQSIRVSDIESLSQALVGTGFGYIAKRRQAQAEILQELLPAVRDIRRAGSAALDLCALAAGRLDAYYEHGLHPWDYAAGALIAAEAGAEVRIPSLEADGDSGAIVTASSPAITKDFHELLQSSGADASL